MKLTIESNYLIILGVIAILVIGIMAFYKPTVTGNLSKNLNTEFSGEQIEVFYGDGCGCCVSYISYLKSAGLNVKATKLADLYSTKKELNIPSNMQSCHTVRIGNYFVEGHVPIEAINKLLEEQPEIDGIALPGMPSGSPGMPGTKTVFTIYSVKDGQATEVFMQLWKKTYF